MYIYVYNYIIFTLSNEILHKTVLKTFLCESSHSTRFDNLNKNELNMVYHCVFVTFFSKK